MYEEIEVKRNEIEILKDIQIQINDRWAGKTYISQVSSDLSETTTNL